MFFKDKPVKANRFVRKSFLFYKKFKRYIQAVIFFVAIVTFICTTASTLKHIKRKFKIKHTRQVIPYSLKYICAKFKALNLKPLPKIEIDIEFKDFVEITAIRNKLTEEGWTLSNLKSTKKWFPAKVVFNNKVYRAKIRLKDNFSSRRNDPRKWSFEIELKGRKEILGMNKFSIHHPENRGYAMDILMSDIAKLNNIISSKALLASVNLNGEDMGIMNIKEFFSKEFLETKSRRSGPIFKIDESNKFAFFKDKDFHMKDANLNYIGKQFVNDYHKISLRSHIGSSRLSKNTEKKYHKAVGLYRSFVRKKISASDVFDTESFGKFFAITSLAGCNTNHAIQMHDARFYFNPITGKIEPIGYNWEFSCSCTSPHKPNCLTQSAEPSKNANLYVNILSDKNIFNQYIIESKKIANDILNNKYDYVFDNYLNNYKYLNSEFMVMTTNEGFYPKNVKERIYNRAKYIKENIETDANKQYQRLLDVIQGKKLEIKKGDKTQQNLLSSYKGLILQAYEVQKNNRTFMEIVNIMPEDIEVTAIKIKYKGKKWKLMEDLKYPIKVAGSRGFTAPENILIPISVSNKQTDYKIEVYAKFAFDKKDYIRKHRSIKYALASEEPFVPFVSLSKQLHKNGFLTKKGRKLFVKPGKWKVKGNIIIPKGYKFIIPAGVTLKFEKEGAIISNDAIEFKGSKNNPVVLQGLDSSEGWQGVAVLEADTLSILENVVFKNPSGVRHKSWTLTGAVTFYKSKINIKNVTIQNNSSEDALNVISSNFEIDGINIKDTYSDGFDCDFCNGILKNSNFSNIGALSGDAVDISSGKVKIENIKAVNIFNKAVSAKGRSSVTINDSYITNASVSFVAKDNSELRINNSKVENMDIACFMAYGKKGGYIGAKVIIKNTLCSNAKNEFKLQDGGIVVIDNVQQKNAKLNKKKFYKIINK